MKLKTGYFALFIAFFVASSFTIVDTSAKITWKKLGTKKVSYNVDKDVLRVGITEGGFTKLKIHVTGGAVRMGKMVVEYGNGSKENIQLRHNFTKGSNSRMIDLKGGKRIIKNITFLYTTKNVSKKRATIHVLGGK